METPKSIKNGKAEPTAPVRKLATPQEFYARFTQKPAVRELLSRLAKK
jgi:hypothetical protein